MGRFKRDGYVALDGRLVDAEKQRISDDFDESDTSFSSRDISGSHEGLLSQPPTAKASFSSYAMPRRRFSRYFTWGIVLLLVGFILTLAHLKSVSETNIKLGLLKPAPKPPAWEEFPFLKRYHGGVRSLLPRMDNKPEYPDPDNNSIDAPVKQDLAEQQNTPPAKRDVQKSTVYSPVKSVKGYEPIDRCSLDADGKVYVPDLHIHRGLPKGFPSPVMGSHDLLGLDNDICFDRYGRLGPYGFGYSKKYGGSGAGIEGEGREEAMAAVWGTNIEIDYRKVRWADAQERCLDKNRFRYKQHQKNRNHFFQNMGVGGPNTEAHEDSQALARLEPAPTNTPQPLIGKRDSPKKDAQVAPPEHSSDKKLLPRTAVVVRTWHDYQYDDEDLFYLRALINELSLQSGGEYTVHFLIHVKDDNLQIWSDDDTYQRVLDNALPEEFRGMGTLWSERQMSLIYGGVAESNYRDLPVYGAYRSTYMPVQYFAHMHPEYDFFWHWEMDIRYTGHFYHFFDRVSSWASRQPRKGLWERNSRFYVPMEHGKWEDFSQMVRVQTEHGTAHKSNMYSKMGNDPKNPQEAEDRPEAPIWGPMPPSGEGNVIENEHDPIPPTEYAKDDYQWGVGEEADFITFNPLFDPDGTNWILNNDVTGYNTNEKYPPRRTAIITASRLSRRLLETMHRETALFRHTMFSEMWPGSCALHHGLKAVYAPHPVYIDRRWPTSYLAAIFNNGRNGAAGGSRTSVFSDERQHNFLGTTWYYHAGFSANLWKRWLGFKVDNDGGEEEEKAGEGRMCLPGMLLHPVKQVDLIYEHQVGG